MAGEIFQQLRAPASLVEDLNAVLKTHTYDSQLFHLQGSDALLWSLGAPTHTWSTYSMWTHTYTHARTHTQIQAHVFQKIK